MTNLSASIILYGVLFGLSLVASHGQAAARAGLSQSNSGQKSDYVRIHESKQPVECLGAKQSELAPESKVVAIYFDETSLLNFQPEALNEKTTASNSGIKTKQSQEFDQVQQVSTDSPSSQLGQSSTTEQPAIVVTSSPPSDQGKPVSESHELPASSSTTGQPTGSGSELTTTPDSIHVDDGSPVASKTIRSGAQVLCGEANPNGKSERKLILDRIVGGRKTEPGEFPFQVRLNIRSRRGSGICGGVILDERHILTAAHCMTACVSQYLTTATIENTGVHATIGDHSIRSNDGEVEVDIAKITPHEKYDACNFYANDHDIAIITTSKPIEYKFTTDGYGSINRPCMPPKDTTYKEGESVIVSGWGVTRENSGSLSNILRYVQVPVVNISRCQDTYGSRVTEEHVCAGYQSGGKDSCQGDSGGPLVRVVENRYELVGIVSFGYGCGQPGAPGVYTRVASYLGWIKANL